MIEEGADCSEILNQMAAIKSAIHHAGIIMFENRVRECITNPLVKTIISGILMK